LDAQRELAEQEPIDKMRFGIPKLLTLHSFKIEDKRSTSPQRKNQKQKRWGKKPKRISLNFISFFLSNKCIRKSPPNFVIESGKVRLHLLFASEKSCPKKISCIRTAHSKLKFGL
jgi:hypothetical protein